MYVLTVMYDCKCCKKGSNAVKVTGLHNQNLELMPTVAYWFCKLVMCHPLCGRLGNFLVAE